MARWSINILLLYENVCISITFTRRSFSVWGPSIDNNKNKLCSLNTSYTNVQLLLQKGCVCRVTTSASRKRRQTAAATTDRSRTNTEPLHSLCGRRGGGAPVVAATMEITQCATKVRTHKTHETTSTSKTAYNVKCTQVRERST